MQSRPLGICLVIDCIGNDGAKLKQTFEALHFLVSLHSCLNLLCLKQILKETAQRRDHKDYDCFVCVVISRGTTDSILATDGKINGVSLDRIKEEFAGGSCPSLLGKPKLFFFQNYLVEANRPMFWSMVEPDGFANGDSEMERGAVSIPSEADILWSCCKVSACLLERSSHQESYYLQSLARVLCSGQKRNMHLLDILTNLNAKIYEKNRELNSQEYFSLQLRHTLRKKLFFSP
nr:PREDICTED: CASP8 and FADD-like apoptosis regulator isoform X1 [Latimeria chalumnae]|eukprot:XP_005995450.1 PREDICTED: CASP8 and FADD-like apoptosis regulator isoform X1 [Latimeria chalumnae]